MNSLSDLRDHALDKTNFATLGSYLSFGERFVDFIADTRNIQALIVSKNENHYRFIQYKKEGSYNVTRPLNSRLQYTADDFGAAAKRFRYLLQTLKACRGLPAEREIINRTIYTAQQAIGCTLDSLPSGKSNTARKINGDLFERFICFVIQELGIDCKTAVVKLPVFLEGCKEPAFHMSYQHDLVIKEGEAVKVIGSVKTSSKDRIDKIFIDKFLFNKLQGKDVPHIAIFLNDVQRKGTEPNFGINSTFLADHFRGYTIKLNPLDGVYYFDIRPNMVAEYILKDHIRTFDHFVFDDLAGLMARDAVVGKIEPIVREDPEKLS